LNFTASKPYRFLLPTFGFGRAVVMTPGSPRALSRRMCGSWGELPAKSGYRHRPFNLQLAQW
jgi:hypothetical protein